MHILRGESLRLFNTLGLQSKATAVVSVTSAQQLEAACLWAQQRDLPLVPLGEGSNVVLAADLDALVLRMATRGIEILESSADSVSLRVAAGENWHSLVEWTLQQGFYGLENLALIPGTVGAAPIQNIGAYGVELQSVVSSVHCRHIADGQMLQLPGADCEFDYRDSVFKHGLRDEVLITAVDLRLSRLPSPRADYPALAGFLAESGIDTPSPEQVFEAVVNIRRSKLPDPAMEPNAGSFFKNPVLPAGQTAELVDRFPGLPRYPQPDGQVKLAAAWMIEHCGWKGFRENGLGIHPEHALVIVNYGNNSGEQLLALAHRVASSVAETFGLQLLIEPRVYR